MLNTGKKTHGPKDLTLDVCTSAQEELTRRSGGGQGETSAL